MTSVKVKPKKKSIMTGIQFDEEPPEPPYDWGNTHSAYGHVPVPSAQPPEIDDSLDGDPIVITPGSEASRSAGSNRGDLPSDGVLFMWCIRCPRKLLAVFGRKKLPFEKVGPGKGPDYTNGIVAIRCYRCKHGNDDGISVKGGKSKLEVMFEEMRIDPDNWQGLEVVPIARTIMETEVPILTDANGKVRYMEVDYILRHAGASDYIRSIDTVKYRIGGRTGLVLPYVVCGVVG